MKTLFPELKQWINEEDYTMHQTVLIKMVSIDGTTL